MWSRCSVVVCIFSEHQIAWCDVVMSVDVIQKCSCIIALDLGPVSQEPMDIGHVLVQIGHLVADVLAPDNDPLVAACRWQDRRGSKSLRLCDCSLDLAGEYISHERPVCPCPTWLMLGAIVQVPELDLARARSEYVLVSVPCDEPQRLVDS